MVVLVVSARRGGLQEARGEGLRVAGLLEGDEHVFGGEGRDARRCDEVHAACTSQLSVLPRQRDQVRSDSCAA